MTTVSTKEGLEDRVLSIVPVAGEIGSGALNPTASLRDSETVAAKGWLLNLEGGMYNEVKQRAVVEMVCEDGAEHVSRGVQWRRVGKGLMSAPDADGADAC